MKNSVQLFLILLLLQFQESYSDIHESIKPVVENIITQNYRKADEELDSILKNDPENIHALYMKVANNQTRILDYESYAFESEAFNRFADSVLKVLQEKLKTIRGDDSLWCLFYIGNVKGGKSVMLAKNGKWLAAAKDGFSSISVFKKLVKSDPDFYAAYLGTGVFKFYLSQNLKWLSFVGGNKAEEGIREIERATQAPPPYDLAAKNSLCWILIGRGEYKKANEIVEEVLAEMPDNTIFLRIKSNIAYNKKEWNVVQKVAQKLIDLSEKREPVNWSDLVLGYEYLIKYYDNENKKRRVLSLSKKALNLDIPDTSKQISFVKEHLEEIRQVRKRYVSDKKD